MKIKMLLLSIAAANILGFQVQAQDSDEEVLTQRLTYVDTHPGKNQEWRQLVRNVSMKIAQMRADSGEIISWTLLRSRYPTGQADRADYIISVISSGNPKSNSSTFAERMESAGVDMSWEEYVAKRRETSSLVDVELWRPRIYNGETQVGNFLTLNLMKVHDWEKIGETTNTWSPMSKEMIKNGSMTAWVFGTKMMPSGSETLYSAYSADIYPSLEAAFASRNTNEIIDKVHPNLDRDAYRVKLREARDVAKREMWEVVERVTKSE